MDSVQTTGEKAACLHDATSAFDHEDNLDGQSDKKRKYSNGEGHLLKISDQKNLRWTGHLMRMSPDRLPKQVLYSQLSSGHRKRGRSRLRFKDTIKRNLKLRDIKNDSWTSLSQQIDLWRATVK